MACPKCGCSETYTFDEDDGMGFPAEDLERCAACGWIFALADESEEDKD